MAYTEFFGLLALQWCVIALVGWLELWRATPAVRRYNRLMFCMTQFWCAATVGQFAFHFIPPMLFQPSSWMVIVEVIWVSLTFVLILAVAIKKLRVASRARNVAHLRLPGDSDT